MVEVDGRDDRDLGIHQISGVEPPAQPGFEHHHLNRSAGECHKRHGSHGLEKTGMRFDLFAGQKPFGGCVNGFEGLTPGLLGNELAIYLDALARIEQMRRRIESGPKPGHAQRGGHHGAGGTFAVGAGDVDKPANTVRAAESGKEGLDVLARSHLTVFSSGPRE